MDCQSYLRGKFVENFRGSLFFNGKYDLLKVRSVNKLCWYIYLMSCWNGK